MSLIEFTEWAAALIALVGTVLLAARSRHAGWAFVAYLASNAGWIATGIVKQQWALVAMQAGFVVSSLIGIRNWLITPPGDPLQSEFMSEVADAHHRIDQLERQLAQAQAAQRSAP